MRTTDISNAESIAVSSPLLVGIPQAAALLSSTHRAVRKIIASGRLPYVHLGARFLIAPADLARFVEERKIDAAGRGR